MTEGMEGKRERERKMVYLSGEKVSAVAIVLEERGLDVVRVIVFTVAVVVVVAMVVLVCSSKHPLHAKGPRVGEGPVGLDERRSPQTSSGQRRERTHSGPQHRLLLIRKKERK